MSLPESNSFEQPPFPSDRPPDRPVRWTWLDLAAFGTFFLLTILFLPPVALLTLRLFDPTVRLENLTGVQHLLLQGVMNALLVGFIYFLVHVVHKRSFSETIHWFRNHQYRTGYLIGLGASLAIGVLIVSSFFPPSEPPPIEKLITSSGALWAFMLFGIAIAPLIEEIIFRGFLFKAFSDVLSPSAAVIATAALFTALHIPQLWGSWAGIALIFVVGYVLGAIRLRSNSVIPPLVIHIAYNSMLFGMFAVSTAVQNGLQP